EAEAKQRAAELIPKKKWPCYFFASDTTGEKAYEEFFTEQQDLDLKRYEHIGVIRQLEKSVDGEFVEEFLSFARAARNDPKVRKADYVRAISKLVPELSHVETGRNLDQK